uniref:Uncharacterized protein n=1 Tax=Opuntia streptacantha TaxID=393608 RepID=A0A7C9DXC7_OPUST
MYNLRSSLFLHWFNTEKKNNMFTIFCSISASQIKSTRYFFFNVSMNLAIFISELPPLLTALTANSFHLCEFFFISSRFMPSMTSLILLSISSLPAIPSAFLLALTPTLHTSSTIFAFIGWSLNCGTPTIGTPRLKPSNVEFHPQ